jgi:hypothetical protein
MRVLRKFLLIIFIVSTGFLPIKVSDMIHSQKKSVIGVFPVAGLDIGRFEPKYFPR